MTFAAATEQAMLHAVHSIGDDVGRRSRRETRRTAYLGVAALGLGSTLVCLLAALWIELAERLGAVAAPLIVAAILLVLSLATLATMRLRASPPPPPPRSPISDLLAELPALVRANKGSTLAVALAAGFAAGAKPR